MTGRRTDLADRIARADPAGLLYGGIVTAAVLATVSAHAETTEHVAIATFAVLVLYWLAHVYVKTQTMQYEGDRRAIHRRLPAAARHAVIEATAAGMLGVLAVFAKTLLH